MVGAREDHDPRVRGRPARGWQDLHRDGSGRGHGQVQGTRWPLEGTFTHIDPQRHLVYEARSWTEGEQDTTTIEHANELRLSEDGGKTVANLRITITEIGSGATLAAFGMKWGYKAQLDKLEAFLAR